MHHLEDDIIERYSLGRVEEPELTEVEEHLLICSQCQERVEAEDQFTRAARAALSRKESAAREPSRPWSYLTTRWAGLAYAGAAVLAIFFLLPLGVHAPAVQTIRLSSLRGPSERASARANTALQLKLDVTGLAPGAYGAELADTAGKPLWRQSKPVTGAELELDVADRLPAGSYWVRLYRGPDQVREFSLVLQ